MLHCLDITSGAVIIDGQDISRISRDDMRKRFMTLPQKSMFIHASIRQNMKLWEEDSSRSPEEVDAEIEAALRKVGLWEALFADTPAGKEGESASDESGDADSAKKKPEPVMLDSALNPDERLSVGQQQLFCLARALFQRADSQIVLMDEFTSSLDHETEMTVRNILKRETKDKTVIEVLHRLEHVMDFDLVVVMDKGKVVEFGHPEDLLESDGGLLHELYHTADD